MGRNAGALSRGLDREVHAAINKYLDNNAMTPAEASIDAIYSYVKKSNSSLGRRSKALLEDCITRILDVMRAEDSSDDSANDSGASHSNSRPSVDHSNNAMNRRLTASWDLSVANRPSESVESSAKKRAQNGSPGNAATTSSAAMTSAREDNMPRSTKRVKFSATKDTKSTLMPPVPRITLGDIGGMDSQIERLKYLLWLPFRMPEQFISQSLTIPRGILLHGPPGCGKTMLCEALAHFLQAPFIAISAPSVVSGMSGESEKAIREQFEKAAQVAPALIFIDEIDAITPKRESAQRQMEARIVAQLLTCMDDLAPEKTGGKPVIVLAATNRPNSLDSALRRAGRFDTEIEIGVPDAEARAAVLRRLTQDMRLAPDVDLTRLSRLTPGFVGADLSSLVREAAVPAQKRFVDAWCQMAQSPDAAILNGQSPSVNEGSAMALDSLPDSTTSPDESVSAKPGPLAPGRQLEAMDALYLSKPELASTFSSEVGETSMDDFTAAVSKVQASAMREGFATIPNVKWSDIGAYHETRTRLQKTMVDPILQPEIYSHFRHAAPGILLYGPPGCGKTLFAKAVASASHANFISVKGPELLNKYVGESEKAVRQLFQRARYSQPAIVFFDELDALVPRRDDAKSEASNRVVNAMLAEMDGIDGREGVYLIAATNRRDAIDEAVLRPGRLGLSIYVGLPGADERVEILATVLRARPVRADAREQMAALARGCAGFSGADLQHLAYEAGMLAIDRCIAAGVTRNEDRFVEVADLQAALAKTRPSVQRVASVNAGSGGGGDMAQ